ncbi:MAG: hypothetical protein AB1831_02940 [Pseudomonadota bacterium]
MKLRHVAFATLYALMLSQLAEAHYCDDTNLDGGLVNQCSKDLIATLSKSVLIKGKNKSFCRALLLERFDYIKFDIDHTVGHEEANAYINNSIRGDGSGRAEDKCALFDIDNDGTVEYVLPLKLWSGAGQGCDREYFAVLAENRSHIMEGAHLNELLDINSCSLYLKPFRYSGKTYLENRKTIYFEGPGYVDLLTNVYLIDHFNRETLCTYEYHFKRR